MCPALSSGEERESPFLVVAERDVPHVRGAAQGVGDPLRVEQADGLHGCADVAGLMAEVSEAGRCGEFDWEFSLRAQDDVTYRVRVEQRAERGAEVLWKLT